VNQAQQLKNALGHFGSVSSELGDLLEPSLADDTALEAQALENDISMLRRRVGEIRQEIEMVWKSGDHDSYEICAVFIHRGPSFSFLLLHVTVPSKTDALRVLSTGTASSGHYFIYQRDSRDPKRWLKCMFSFPTARSFLKWRKLINFCSDQTTMLSLLESIEKRSSEKPVSSRFVLFLGVPFAHEFFSPVPVRYDSQRHERLLLGLLPKRSSVSISVFDFECRALRLRLL